MKSTTIQEAQKMVDQWIHTTGVKYFSELTNLGILMEEVGELASLMVRKYGEQSFKDIADKNDLQIKIEYEMADVLFVVICLANQCNIDLNQAFMENLKKKSKRDHHRHKNNPKLRPPA